MLSFAAATVVYNANADDPDALTTILYTLSGADAALFSLDGDRLMPGDSRSERRQRRPDRSQC